LWSPKREPSFEAPRIGLSLSSFCKVRGPTSGHGRHAMIFICSHKGCVRAVFPEWDCGFMAAEHKSILHLVNHTGSERAENGRPHCYQLRTVLSLCLIHETMMAFLYSPFAAGFGSGEDKYLSISPAVLATPVT
jgi:hypothetical protein